MAEKKPATKAGRKKTSDTKAKTQATQATVTAEGGVNVRTSPKKGDNIKRVLPYGAEVTIQAQTTDNTGTAWAQIAPHEFIMRRFLKTV